MWSYFLNTLGFLLCSTYIIKLCKRKDPAKKDSFDYLSDGFNPIREMPEPEAFLIPYFFLFEQGSENIHIRYFHSRVERMFANYVVWCLNTKIFYDSPRNLEYTLKLQNLYELYILLWNNEMQDEIEKSFVQELVETMWENDVNLYQIFIEFHKVFKHETSLISRFEEYIRTKEKCVLKYSQLKRNPEDEHNFFFALLQSFK